ncbi:unnamed protein product [Paramecium sonneborni]|uniref:Uncharacterized protein n=1 Tax=Paramecium sonneborni TaxID=65129 RepID=A0A8S1QT67_9CILI|nr:unnamed protein product [Paramecium sonneborni]
MKIDQGLNKKHDKIKKVFLQALILNAQQKTQLKVIEMRKNYNLMKRYLFNWNLALMRKYRMKEICYFVKNQYRKKLQKKIVQLLNDYTLKRQHNRRKLIRAENYYNNRILQKSFRSLRINEKQSKQEFLEKRKLIDEKEQKFIMNQKELQKKLMAEAFYSSKLIMKSFLNWKKFIFFQDKQDYYFNYTNRVENWNLKQQEQQVEKEKINKNGNIKSEYCIMLEEKIKFYQKYQDQLTSFQKEVLKKEICQLKQLQ